MMGIMIGLQKLKVIMGIKGMFESKKNEKEMDIMGYCENSYATRYGLI